MNYDDYRDTDVNFSDCFPFCSGTDYGGPSVSWSNEPTCITRVPFSANGYSSIVSAAVSSDRYSTTTTGPATNEATPTSTSDYNRDNQEATSTGSGDSTMNAAPIATAGSILGGAAFAAAMLAL